MPWFFAAALLLSLAFALAIAFSSGRARSRLKVLLVLSVLLTWIALGLRLRELAVRTASTVITPGGPRHHLEPPARREALVLLGSHGGPALLVTILAWLAVRASRPGKRRPPPGQPG